MGVKKFNVIINSYCFLKMQVPTQTGTDTEIWSDKGWAISFFYPRQGPTSPSSTNSKQLNEGVIWCRGSQAENRDVWVSQGLNSSVLYSIWKGSVRSGKVAAWRRFIL